MVTKMEKHCARWMKHWVKNDVYGKTMGNIRNKTETMENVRNKIDVSLVSNKNDY